MDRNVDQEIQALEENLTVATREMDIKALEGLYADDIIFTGVTGVICSKPAIMDEARRGLAAREAAAATSGSAAVVSYEKDDLRAVRHGSTGVASFRFGVTIRSDGQEVTRYYRTTNVWVKRGDAWQVVAAHTAVLG